MKAWASDHDDTCRASAIKRDFLMTSSDSYVTPGVRVRCSMQDDDDDVMAEDVNASEEKDNDQTVAAVVVVGRSGWIRFGARDTNEMKVTLR
jgi:hypothetical protein